MHFSTEHMELTIVRAHTLPPPARPLHARPHMLTGPSVNNPTMSVSPRLFSRILWNRVVVALSRLCSRPRVHVMFLLPVLDCSWKINKQCTGDFRSPRGADSIPTAKPERSILN